jgi:tetratricopeptide (TPR) repeat protein
MAKIGRNDLCHCGSGKKYKRCCMADDEAAAREKLADVAAAAAANHDPHLCDDCNDHLYAAADAVFVLIDAKKFAEAEKAAHELQVRFPSVHDGYECLGRLHQAKGDYRQASDYYRKVIEFARNEPHLYDPDFVEHFQSLINRLEPQATAN